LRHDGRRPLRGSCFAYALASRRRRYEGP
jgi:hypothetical protein